MREMTTGAKLSIAVLVFLAGIGCLAPAVTMLGEGDMMGGRILLGVSAVLVTGALVTSALLLTDSIRNKWLRGTAVILPSLLFGCFLLGVDRLQAKTTAPMAPVAAGPPVEDRVAAESRTDTPEAEAPFREEQQPPPPAEHFFTVIQETSGDNSPAIVADGPVTFNPPADPNVPVVYYFPNGQTRTQIGSTITIADGRTVAFDTIRSLNEANEWVELARVCEEEIEATPDWLTPYLFAGVAYANLGNLVNARRRLEQFSTRASANPDYADWHSQCIQFLEQLDETQADDASSGSPSGTVTPIPADQQSPTDSE